MKRVFFVLLLLSILVCGIYAVKITNWRVSNTAVVVPRYANRVGIFDTGSGTYPSIFGMHRGEIIPSRAISASRLYTYPCTGTSGHSEHVKIWNSSWAIEASWNGYRADWHNITFPERFVLEPGEAYNYTIRTGSYPQIIHTREFNTEGGKITCEEFMEANGRRYDNWIPAVKLY